MEAIVQLQLPLPRCVKVIAKHSHHRGKGGALVRLIDDAAGAPLSFHQVPLHSMPRKCLHKTIKDGNIMQIIIKTMNIIGIREFLRSGDGNYGDIIYFSEVRWPNQEQMW